MTETRHSHGGNWHDHPGGEASHDHGRRIPNDPAAEPRRSTYRDAVRRAGDSWIDREEQKRSGHGGSSAFGFGTVFIVLGTLAFFYTSSNHSACSSALVQAVNQSQCSEVNHIWTIGVLGLVVGVALIIVGAILRGNSGSRPSP